MSFIVTLRQQESHNSETKFVDEFSVDSKDHVLDTIEHFMNTHLSSKANLVVTIADHS